MCHELQNSGQKYLPYEDIKSYLVQILEKTDNEKHILDSECRKAQDILHFYCTRNSLLETNQNPPGCTEDCTTIEKPSESEKEIVSKVDAAIKHAKNVMKEVEKEMKNPKKFVKSRGTFALLKDRKMCNKKESFDNCREQDNGKLLSNKSAKIKKQGSDLVKDNVKQISCDIKRKSGNTAKGGDQFITTYKKDFISKNKQVKNFGLKCTVIAPLVPKDKINDVESIHFNGIDDLLERVTPHPSVVPTSYDNKCDSIKFVRNSSTATVLSNSLVSERTGSKWESSGDLMKVLVHYCELISLVKNNRKRLACSSSFLLKLKERNKNLISTENASENYTSSMKMMSKCSTGWRNYTYSSITDFEGTSRMICSDDPKHLQLELRMCASDVKYLQLELLNLLKKNLNIPLQKNLNSTLFYKTCDSLVNISPK